MLLWWCCGYQWLKLWIVDYVVVVVGVDDVDDDGEEDDDNDGVEWCLLCVYCHVNATS